MNRIHGSVLAVTIASIMTGVNANALPANTINVAISQNATAAIVPVVTHKAVLPARLNLPRFNGHTLTRLHDGTVLIVGGLAGDTADPRGTETAELYEPVSGRVTMVGAMSVARAYHTATLLNDGRVLVTGGTSEDGTGPAALSSAEVYDPATRQFSSLPAMDVGRYSHTATRLLNGQVLIVGGDGVGPIWKSALLFDPQSNTFKPVARRMAHSRVSHTATLLDSGEVLIAGGTNYMTTDAQFSAELYNPNTQRFRSLSHDLDFSFINHTASKLGSGKVLLSGTQGSEIFESKKGSLTILASQPASTSLSAVTALSDGSVFFAGGQSFPDSRNLASVEVYSEGQDQFRALSPLSKARLFSSAIALDDDNVAVIGGVYGNDAAAANIEIVRHAAQRARPNAPQVAAGFRHTLVLKADGSVWAFGGNNYGQLGLGSFDGDYSSPQQLTSLHDVTALSSGMDFSLALKGDGTVWAFGRNDRGQLGTGSHGAQAQPHAIRGLTAAIAVSAGARHGLALKADGSVWSWGDNHYGQLGLGSSDPDVHMAQVIPGLNNVIAIATGADHSLALKTDGSIWAWGNNGQGQLATGTTDNQPSPIQIVAIDNIVAVAAGSRHTLALKADGSLWVWGDNQYGQLGIGNRRNQTSPQNLSAFPALAKIAAGADDSMAMSADGTMWTWGRNQFGQLGLGNTIDAVNPVALDGMNATIALAPGATHTTAMRSDGSLYVWGNNAQGQLGLGTHDEWHAPQAIDPKSQVSTTWSVSPIDLGVVSRSNTATMSDVTLSVSGDMKRVDFDANDVVSRADMTLAYKTGSCLTGDLSSSCQFSVATQANQRSGQVFGQLTFLASNTFTKAIMLPVTARVRGSELRLLETGAHFYGVQKPGSLVDKTWTFSNRGDAKLEIFGTSIAGNAFSVLTNTCAGTVLLPFQQCAISVRYSALVGGVARAELHVFSSDSVQPDYRVDLSAETGAPHLEIKGTLNRQLSMGDIPLGQSTVKTVSLANAGSETLLMTNVTVTGKSFSLQGNDCGSKLAAGSSCHISLGFKPDHTGKNYGKLIISSNDIVTPEKSVSLVGTSL